MLKYRPGDQPLPTPNVGGASVSNDCQSTVMARLSGDIPARRKVGIERYGQGLVPFNGRDSIRDCWEEILDLMTYFEQIRREWLAMQQLLMQLATARENTDNWHLVTKAQDLMESMGKGNQDAPI